MSDKWHDESVSIFSNAESGNGMKNGPGHFNVRLPKPIMLHGMEVAVKNVTFPTSWNPIPLKDRQRHTPRWGVTIGYDGSEGSFPPERIANVGPLAQWTTPHRTMLFTLAHAPFKTTEKVVAQMIRQMYEVLPISTLGLMWSVVPVDYDRPRRVVIQQKTAGGAAVNRKAYSVWANEALCKLLHFGQDPNDGPPERYLITGGLDAGRFVKREDISNSQHLPSSFKLISDKHKTSIKNAIDLDANAIPSPDAESQFQRFLVYCDFIQDRIVGGIRTGLLNVTPNPGMMIQHNTTSFSTESISPLYYPVKDLTFQSFTFRVRDDYGDDIDFGWGVTSLELHFRRRPAFHQL